MFLFCNWLGPGKEAETRKSDLDESNAGEEKICLEYVNDYLKQFNRQAYQPKLWSTL